ncbi:MAG: BTAD domain-containing putative transcriptional regulator, partial [Gemmatimonadaceae bacterium]
EFERWLDGERARLAERYATTLATLAEQSEEQGDPAGAAGWWRRLAAHDPYSARVTLRLMRAMEAAGDRAGALQHARAHAAILREEFDAEPEPDVAAFAERLRVEPPGGLAAELPSLRKQIHGPASPIPASRRRYAITAAAMLLLVAVVGLRGMRGDGADSSSSARSVGVLAFVNMSADPEHVYFSDGLSEQIIAELSRIEGLRVAARTSSFALRESELDVRTIGDTLDVAAVLEGSVRRTGSRLRVTAQLIDANTGYHIWSEDYDRELSDVFAVQEEIARAIAGALELRLAGRSATPDARHRPGLEAYDLYLRGLYLRNTLSADGLAQAAAYFDRAIRMEPRFALAYAAKSSVIAPQIYFGYVERQRGLEELRALTSRALELDSTLGEAHASLGVQRLFFEWDWSGAEKALRRAVELNPSDPHAYHHLANYLNVMDRASEAVAARERSAEIDPLNARTRITLANDYGRVGNDARAMSEYRRAAEMDPMNPLLLGVGPGLPVGPARQFAHQGRFSEAIDEYLRLANLRGATRQEVQSLRRAFETSGMSGFWREWMAMDLRLSGGTINPMRMAALLTLVGDTLRAFEWLDRAFQERDAGLVYLPIESSFESLRTHPRVARILKEMSLTAR